jgi:hypothetical protein
MPTTGEIVAAETATYDATVFQVPGRLCAGLTMLRSASVMITRDDLRAALEPYPTREELRSELERFATKQDLERFATKQDLAELRSDLRQQMLVLYEDLKAQIQAGFDAILGVMEASGQRLQNMIDGHDRRLDDHEIRITTLESRKRRR